MAVGHVGTCPFESKVRWTGVETRKQLLVWTVIEPIAAFCKRENFPGRILASAVGLEAPPGPSRRPSPGLAHAATPSLSPFVSAQAPPRGAGLWLLGRGVSQALAPEPREEERFPTPEAKSTFSNCPLSEQLPVSDLKPQLPNLPAQDLRGPFKMQVSGRSPDSLSHPGPGRRPRDLSLSMSVLFSLTFPLGAVQRTA